MGCFWLGELVAWVVGLSSVVVVVVGGRGLLLTWRIEEVHSVDCSEAS